LVAQAELGGLRRQHPGRDLQSASGRVDDSCDAVYGTRCVNELEIVLVQWMEPIVNVDGRTATLGITAACTSTRYVELNITGGMWSGALCEVVSPRLT
jgi:hypothetical protein